MADPVGQNKKESLDDKAWWQPALIIFARTLSWIAAPVILGSYAGRWLDRKYGSEPWLFIGTVGLAFLISMFGLIKETAEQYKKIEKDGRDKAATDDKKIKS